jgi:2'-5' RNA ligase
MRIFVSINLTPETKKQLLDVQEKIRLSLTGKEPGAMRWEAPDKLHITLFFIGDITPAKLNEVKNVLNSLEYSAGKLSLNMSSIGGFPNLRSPRVIFANIKDDGKLVKLANEIHSEMTDIGFNSDKPFHPHITLGRIKRDRKVSLTKLSEINFNIEFETDAFYLMESKLKPTGSVYSKRERFELQI